MQVSTVSTGQYKTVLSKGRRGGDIYGGERPRRGKISLKSRRGGLGEENRSIFPRRGH